MAKQTIGIGASANDGTGDPLRTAFDKCNDNFDELYGKVGNITDEASYLDINDALSFDDSLFQAGARILHNYKDAAADGGNLFVGLSAGNRSMGTPGSGSSTEIAYGTGIGSYNVAVGFRALTSNTDGLLNVAVGYDALKSNTIAVKNTAIGAGCMPVSTTANGCTGVGAYALQFLTTGIYNTAVGTQSLRKVTTGQRNTAIGLDSMHELLTGGFNCGLGSYTLNNNTAGSYNTAVGESSLSQNTASNNTALGYFTGHHVSDANQRVTADSNLTLIGCEATKNTAATISNSIAIGYQAKVTASNTAVIGNSSVTGLVLGSGNTFQVAASGVTINEAGSDSVDFRVESDIYANMLFVDASTNSIGVVTASPGVAGGICIQNSSGSTHLRMGSDTFYYDVGRSTANGFLTFTGNQTAARGFVFTSGCVGIGTSSFGTSATMALVLGTGTAPSSSPADVCQIYSADQTAGNACPHIRTENGGIVKLYKETTGVAEAAFVENSGGTAVNVDSTFGGYTIQQVVQALQNQGLLT